MRKIYYIIIAAVSFLAFCFLIVWCAYSEEAYHESPCEISGELFIDSLEQKYKLLSHNVTPKNFQYRGNSYDASKVDCSIINSYIWTDKKIDFQSDSIIKELSSIFWLYPKNQFVDSLYLEIRNHNQYLYAAVSKSDLTRESKKVDYKKNYKASDIKRTYTANGVQMGGGGEMTKYEINFRKIYLSSKVDLNDYQTLADQYYQKEYSDCLKNNIATLEIEINTEDPEGQLIYAKVNHYYYQIIPSHFYYKKKEES